MYKNKWCFPGLDCGLTLCGVRISSKQNSCLSLAALNNSWFVKKEKNRFFCLVFFFFNFDKAGQHLKPTHHGDPAHGRELELDDILGFFQPFPMVLK